MENTIINTRIKWSIDTAHSDIGFKVKHLMVTNVRGVFTDYDASIFTPGEDFLGAEIDFWLNPASVNTGDAKRDEHLKSADFFDAGHFKQINFTANTIQKVGEGKYEMYGDLTIKGIKKKIMLDVEFAGVIKDPWGNHKAGFTINGKINRKEWGLNWNAALETGGVLVGEEVSINCEIQLTRQS
ncbi:MAG TPA: YceI family protein [Puia sp.]|nr:YceI family protein [Puia sp.]